MKRNGEKPREAHLLGIGLDHDDGHQRITRAGQFSIVWGSEETHERMTETLVKTFDHLRRQDKKLEDTEPQELADLIHENTPR